jgi:hypothetical protein
MYRIMSNTKGEGDRNKIVLDIEDDKCPSKNKEPKTPTDETDYKKQVLIFNPHTNPECKDDATTKMANLNKLYEEFINQTDANGDPTTAGPNAANQNAAANTITTGVDTTTAGPNAATNPAAAVDPNAADPNAAITNADATNTTTAVDPNAAAANTNADAAITNATTTAATTAAITTTTAAITPADNTVYAIIQIDAANKKTVLDAIPDGQTLNTTDSPYDLLVKKTPSVFAVKIVKKENCNGASDKIICIDFENSYYEMDLTTVVSNEPTLLLNQEFLTGSAEVVEDAKDADKVADEGAVVPGSEVAEGKDAEGAGAGSEVAEGKVAGSEVAVGSGSEVAVGSGTEGAETVDDKKTGGSRKKRTQKSKKTKRKYYVYRK